MREIKDSGIEWFPQIPANWATARIKDVISVLTDYTANGSFADLAKNVEYHDYDDYARLVRLTDLRDNLENPGVYVDKESYEYLGKSKLFGNEILVANVGAYAGLFCEMPPIDMPATLGPNMFLIRTNQRMSNHYLYYLGNAHFVWEQLAQKAFSSAQPKLNKTDVKTIHIVIPPMKQQRRIAAHLDAKCAEIDALIADIQTQIDTLEQYKRSVITETVTKGLNPDAELKDSCIQWIGMMPSHWDCIRGKYILKYIQKPVREDDGVITCFRDGEVTLRSNRREDGFTMADKEIGYQGIDVGDLVVHGMDGFAGAIGISDSRGKASPVLNVLGTEQNKRYIMYFLRSMAYSDVFLALATGIRVRSCDLRWNKLAELFYPVPPIEEQDAIVGYIDSVLAKANNVIATKKEQLSVLEAYKKSLIFEYVTGKKEVPTPITAVMVNPNVILLGKLPKMLSKQKGKIYNQKVLYLLNTYLGLNLNVQYYRYPHGPYDVMLDSYIDTLVKNGWCVKTVNNGAENLEIGPNYSVFEEKYGSCFSEHATEIDNLIQFFQPMKRSQIERVATLFAVWNDMILDGNGAPTDAEIVAEVISGWTENKANFAYDTWLGTLNKMKSNGIVPKGQGLHTLPRDC